ncbi:MAG: RluA family pseudouridine synthase [Clostridia bacterium]|nr:RluA family pseudouridine synthase [Clostridia bacterium]
MERIERICVMPEQAGQRVDALLSEQMQHSRSAVQQWLTSGRVTVNGRPLAKNYKLRGGEEIEVSVPSPVVCEAKAEDLPLDVLYEDAHLLVVNKPKGMVVHPAAGHYTGTLVNALLFHCGDTLSGINGVLRPGIVHRIDKDTSGLLMVAKTDIAHQSLAEQIKAHTFTRIYEAVVVGRLPEESGTIEAPIGRHPNQRKKMTVIATNSKSAVTHYRVLEYYPGNTHSPGFTHVRLQLETGRTHQIRVHMAYLGHPVAGDIVYGAANQPKICEGLGGQCLHAKCVGFMHPVTEENLYFESDLPSYFTDFLQRLTKA